ncbi:flagellar operon protein (TIGR03826 family) [Natranaerovirga hydrolytica]|uniref:Flagellar operon protein (TIGR03826 family) n=1 Tax=Natranaerovirga hydrolytica TaxID=680378 RepID=A0A4R1MPW2_9FIRM|nr:flagellar protein [Natranaerovirga hydrolytica]TCK93374.1 flagellar operon protein (TIGR03826 family) [Natranaerovirga hydrolytica]
MEVRNCRSCGKIFNYIGGKPICPTCKNELEDTFQEVKAYIKDNPNAQIYDVAEENEVSVGQIKEWVREERLTFSPDSAVGIDCENCGTTIKTGRFCNRCKDSLAKELGGAYAKKQTPEINKEKNTSTKMRYLNKDNMRNY